MKTLITRSVSLLIVLLLAVSMFGGFALAEEAVEEARSQRSSDSREDAEFSLSDGRYKERCFNEYPVEY